MSNTAKVLEGELVGSEVIENETVESPENELDELDAFINSFDSEEEISDEEAEDAERAAVLEVAKSDAYEEQDTKLEAEDIKMEKAEPTAEKPAKKARVVTKDMNLGDAIRAKLGDKVYSMVLCDVSEAELDEDALKAIVDDRIASFEGLAKKVREKVLNFYSYLDGSAKLSCYTKEAIELLKSDAVVTSVDIKNHYLGHPYSVGTASAQSSQMMQLLPAIGVAKVSGRQLVLNEESAVLPLLSA